MAHGCVLNRNYNVKKKSVVLGRLFQIWFNPYSKDFNLNRGLFIIRVFELVMTYDSGCVIQPNIIARDFDFAGF